VLAEPRLKRMARPVEPDHSVVGRDSHLLRSFGDRGAMHDDAHEYVDIGGLQRTHERQRAPAWVFLGLRSGKLYLVDVNLGQPGPAQLVSQHVTDHPTEPRFDTRQITQLAAAGERTLGRELQDVLCIDQRARTVETTASPSPDRRAKLARALGLEYLTVGWNLVEGIIAVSAAVLAAASRCSASASTSFVESASGLVMIWRLQAERRGSRDDATLDAIEHRARKLVALSLFLLAAFVVFDAVDTLWAGERPVFTLVGVILTSVSLVVMLWLARAKRRVARNLGSQAMEADAFQTTACWWLSLAALVGITVNGALGWWWADPVAALEIAALIAWEAREAWEGKQDCC
jgi:Co/Zn/Cd efflux system component